MQQQEVKLLQDIAVSTFYYPIPTKQKDIKAEGFPNRIKSELHLFQVGY
jgi:hypothetical protein